MCSQFGVNGILLADSPWLRSLLAYTQSRTVLCFSLFEREHSSAKISELGQFLLDRSEQLLPLAVSKLSLGFVTAFASMLVA
jgi:hypothetical protein